MKKIRVGINGFGRIGRITTRIAFKHPEIEVCAINSRASASSHAYLLKYDSLYGEFHQSVTAEENSIVVNKKKIAVFQCQEPQEIPWKDVGIDIVVEATGAFRKKKDAERHLTAGARRVIITAPPKDDIPTVCVGVNEETLDPSRDFIVSNASCTTNCLAVVCKVVDQTFEIERGFMTTTHAYTDSQNLMDNSHKKDFRLGRAAALSIIPTDTGASKALGRVLPTLRGRILASSLRVPVACVSLIDLVVLVKKTTSKGEVNQAFIKASKTRLQNILSITSDPLVSSDLKSNNSSAIIDTSLTEVNKENLINIKAWYDNEWGYCSRVIDLIKILGKKLS